MKEIFELNRGCLRNHLRSLGLNDRRDLSLQKAVATWAEDDRFDCPDPALALAHLAYLLGISTHLVVRPNDFPAHSLLGISGSFGGWPQTSELMILLSSQDGPFVARHSPAVLELLDDCEGSGGFALLAAACESILADATGLIPAARAAASSSTASGSPDRSLGA